jgi:superfamily II DNA/RNA helicase
MSFDLMGLADETLRAVTEAGYETPTPIQKQAIPVVLQGRDVMGIAQTGTGKTAGFTLPMIDILSQGRARARMPRSLILEPTRELAAQVAESFETYGKYHKLTMALLIGGVSFDEQNRLLDRGVDVLIATPGRLLDHFERGRLMMSGVEVLVVDEADRMLDMGFIPDIERICKMMPQRHQTLFFSATMPSEIKRLSDTFLDDPKHLEVARPTSPAETVEQFLVMEKSKEAKAKRDRLRTLIEGEKIGNAIVFCNRKKDVDIVAKSLKKHGHNAAALHGDMDQMSRMKVLGDFKADNIKILVASDVAARGLDIPAVSHVFNFDVPNHAEDYIHRIGRTGRAGRSGRSITICSPLDTKYLAAVQDMIGRNIPLFNQSQAGGTPKSAEAPKADDASTPVTTDEDKPRRRNRRRRGGRRSEETSAPKETPAEASASTPAETSTDADASDAPAAAPDASPAPAPATAPTSANAEDTSEEKPRRSRSRGGRNRNRNDRGDGNDRSDRNDKQNNNSQSQSQSRKRTHHGDKIPEPNGIKGLGDHTPAFLLQPVIIPGSKALDDAEDEEKPKKKTARKASPKKTPKPKNEATVEAKDGAKDKVEATAEEKPKRRRRAKKVETKAAPVNQAAEDAVTEDAAVEGSVEARVEAKSEENPKRKRAPRKRKTAAQKAAEEAAKIEAAPDSTVSESTASESNDEPPQADAG